MNDPWEKTTNCRLRTIFNGAPIVPALPPPPSRRGWGGMGDGGGGVGRLGDDKAKVPAQLHFGEKDSGIPLSDVETIRAKRPDVEIFVYPGAQHGFHCDERASYDKTSADIAWPRSMGFFAKHLKK